MFCSNAGHYEHLNDTSTWSQTQTDGEESIITMLGSHTPYVLCSSMHEASTTTGCQMYSYAALSLHACRGNIFMFQIRDNQVIMEHAKAHPPNNMSFAMILKQA